MSLLTTTPIWIAVVVLIGGGTALAMLGTVVVRWWVPLERLRDNNEVAGFKFATVGVIYAVLLAFAVLVVWERFNEAEGDVAAEAATAVTLFRLADGMDAARADPVRAALTSYLDVVISEDWPEMARGAESPAAVGALNDLYAALLDDRPVDARGAAILAESLHQADELTKARRARIALASGSVPGFVWLALFVGAAVTVSFTFFFGLENHKAQMVMTGALSLLLFLGLTTVVAIDRPFSGSIRVDPGPLVVALEDFSAGTPARRPGG
jgi:hypothetical protein